MEGSVFVDGQRVDKPGTAVDPDKPVEVRGEQLAFVSRGGKKLEKALKVFPVDPAGKLCIDCGASTGGFTDVLLQNGAKKVYAVDVGYGQLAWKLRTDERVVNMERTNLRYVTREQIPEPLDLAVMDVSFISIRLILPVAAEIMGQEGRFLTLIKPQFEAGRGKVGKNGVVRDPKVHEEVIRGIADFCSSIGWQMTALDHSPITGPKGNIEFLAEIRRADPAMPSVGENEIRTAVSAAHHDLL
jgi:23S rRNA (cytidine1920-2'-O)/16S rRNA (cytidine1409-2'-O)-methyltransferase